MRSWKGILVFNMALSPLAVSAQLAPGPLETLPFEEAFIFEAWADLQAGQDSATGHSRADWTGWSGTSWSSPYAYNGHQGSDFAIETYTPILAPADGVVLQQSLNLPVGDHTPGAGNLLRMSIDGAGGRGETMEASFFHLYPEQIVNIGDRVTKGQLIAYSDNNGSSTSEHLHYEIAVSGQGAECPWYQGLMRYPVMFNPNAQTQVGHIVEVREETPVWTEDDPSAPGAAQIGTALPGQRYFASFWERGYYRIFLPGVEAHRSGWISALHIEEVFDGTVLHPVQPYSQQYTATQTMATPYAVRAEPEESAAVVGRLHHYGGRFAATEEQNGWYRIPMLGEGFGWVRPDDGMIVYPEVHDPSIDPEDRPWQSLPIRESFSEAGRSSFGRAKFVRGRVREFSPASPEGDGLALFLTDAINTGNGTVESVVAGRPEFRDYYVQADVYLNFQPNLGGWNRYGIMIRDDGFGGLDDDFEGPGNSYAMLWDSDDGRLRAARVVDAPNHPFNFLPEERLIQESGWRTFRVEAEGDQIRYFLDGELLVEVTDTTFPSGPGGMVYSNRTIGNPSSRGAYFDNFEMGYLSPMGNSWSIY